MRKSILVSMALIGLLAICVGGAQSVRAQPAAHPLDIPSPIQITATPGDLYSYSKMPVTEHLDWSCPSSKDYLVQGDLFINWGDGSPETHDYVAGITIAYKEADYTHTYQNAGTYTVSLRVGCSNYGGGSTYAYYTAYITTPTCSAQTLEYDTTPFTLAGHSGTLGVYLEEPKVWQGSCVSNGVLISVAEMRLSNGASTGRVTAVIFDTGGLQHNHTDTNFSAVTYADATTTYGESCGHARATLTIGGVSTNVQTSDHCV